MNELMRWRMFAYMLALFIAGAICGAAVTSHMAAGSQTLKVGRTGEIEGIIKQKLILNLDLTPEQKAKFEPLVKKTSEDLEASHLECLRRVCDSLDKMHEQMKPDLTEEQREKMKKVETERRANMKKKYNYPPEAARTAGN